MTILLTTNSMQIRVKDNKMLTKIVRMVDGTPLQWTALSDIYLFVEGEGGLLYELLHELTTIYPGIIEIIWEERK